MEKNQHLNKLQPTKEDMDIIAQGAATGASRGNIAQALGVNVKTLSRWLKDSPELSEAFYKGREKERQALHGVLFEQAQNGNITAAIFLLKTRHGYREGDQSEQANKVSINFQIPGAMPLEKFMGAVDESGKSARIKLK